MNRRFIEAIGHTSALDSFSEPGSTENFGESIQMLSKSAQLFVKQSLPVRRLDAGLMKLLSNLVRQIENKLCVVDGFQRRWRFERRVEPGVQIPVNKQLKP